MTAHVNTPPTSQAARLPFQLGKLPEPYNALAEHGSLTCADVVDVAELLGIDFAVAPFSLEDLHLALAVELGLEHECAPSMVDALDEDLVELGTIAVINLRERSDYYTQ